MPDQPLLDIATADNWFGFSPGMTRAQVLELLKKRGVAETKHRDDNFSAVVDDHNIDFWFATDGSERLRQMALEEGLCWNGKPLIDLTLDEALQAFEPLGQPPMWEANDATDEPFPEPGTVPVGLVPDEELLEEGTVWMRERGLGLVLWQGGVIDVVWRAPQDLPAQFAGPVTPAQRQLSRQPAITVHGPGKASAGGRAAPPKKTPSTPLQTVLIWVCLGLLAFIGREAFRETRRWAQAPVLNGKFVSLEHVPRKKFLDPGPERLRRLMPDDPVRVRDLYRIEYLDPTGRRQTATLESGEFYVAPREPGEEVEFAYLAGDPPRVKGLSRVRDVAFLEYMPWAMLVGVFYIVGLFVLNYLPHLLRFTLKAAMPKGGGADPDRPEMR